MLRRVVLSAIAIVLMLAVGAGGFFVLMSLREKPPVVEPTRPTLTVQAMRVEPQTLIAPIEGFGTARADRLALIGAEVAGQVVAVHPNLRVGAEVLDGDVLLRIDSREYEAQLERARSQRAADTASLAELDVREVNLKDRIATATGELEVAEREYSRVLRLYEAGTSNPRELDAARLALQQARRILQTLEGELNALPAQRARIQALIELRQAEVDLADLSVERCTIRAPFSGRLDRVQVEIGERVVPGQQLVALLDPSLIDVGIELPLSLRSRVRTGAAAHLRLESQPHVNWTGAVARIGPQADEMTRTFTLYVEVRNDGQQTPLMPGAFVTARVDGPRLEDALLVPRNAIRRQRVFVAEDGVARQRPVEIETRLLDRAVVRGLQPGDVVITSNLDALFDGTPVNPVLAPATAEQRPGPAPDDTLASPPEVSRGS
jgi:multidrug efflux system membrane fusion protein